MTKKIFNAPYLKVVEVKNDIIATSDNGDIEATIGGETGIVGAPGRHGMWDEDFDGEDLY